MGGVNLSRVAVNLLLALLLPTLVLSTPEDVVDKRLRNIPPTRGKSYFDLFRQIRSHNQRQHTKVDETLLWILQDAFSMLYRPYLSDASGDARPGQPLSYLLANSPEDDAKSARFQQAVMSAVQAMAGPGVGASTCVNDTGRLITSLFNRSSWASNFLDATGRPGPGLKLYRFNFVGNWKQCRAAKAPADPALGEKGFNGNYCSLRAFIGKPSPVNQFMIQLGACMPDTCSEFELTVFVYELIQQFGLNNTLTANNAECRTNPTEMTAATIVSIIVVCIIGTLMILGTSYDILVIQWPKWRTKAAEEALLVTNAEKNASNGYAEIGAENTIEVVSSSETTALLNKPQATRMTSDRDSTGVLAKILIAFSVYTNGSKVLNTSQPPGSLSAINGIRFLSMSWVILGHCFAFVGGYAENMSDLGEYLGRWTFDAISNALVSVDTFFTLSGLLTGYLTIREMKKKGWRINWGLFYFHRFWRLTPPYMLTLLLVLGFQQYLGRGALWENMEPTDKEMCEDNWWTNLLYVNNLVNTEKMCFGHSWYLANDMQFFVISPLMILPFYFNAYAGLAMCTVVLLVNWITTGVLSNHHKWPSTMISVFGGAGPNGGADFLTYFMDYYITPWCRIGPYVIGLLTGWLLAVSNSRIRMRRYVAAIGWIVAVAMGLAVVYGLRGDIEGSHPNSVSVAAFYNAVARSAWGACVCWVIIACVAGYGGFVNTILSWSPFVALGRLTYMAYLIHPCLIYIYYMNAERLQYITDTTMVITFLGILVITNLVSFVLMLGLESPMIGLEKTFLRRERKD